jgi:hypothetical protein
MVGGIGFRPEKLCQACEGNFSDQQYYKASLIIHDYQFFTTIDHD